MGTNSFGEDVHTFAYVYSGQAILDLGQKRNYNIYFFNQDTDTRAGLSHEFGWPEVLISFSVTLSNSVRRH